MVRAIHTCIKHDIREEISDLNNHIQFFAPSWFPFDNFFSTPFNFFTKNSGNQILSGCIYNNLVQMKYSGFSKCFTDSSKFQEGVSAAVYMEEQNICLIW